MKQLLRKPWKTLPAILFIFAGFPASAQLNCNGVTQMYAMFKEQSGANGNSYISPVSYSTGIPGAAMAPGVFVVPRAGTTTGSTAWGSTSLAADMFNNRFFYMTADYNSKDLWAGNAVTGAQVKIADAFPTSLNGYYFVKAAVSPDGFVYSMSTNRSISGTPDTKLIRWNSCGTANCAVIQVMAVIPNSQFNANLLYNGDLAFAANGDMYIFGSEVDPATGTYVKASAFRILATDMPIVPGVGSIPITRIGDIPALDNMVISGFAFDGAGNWYLATIDQATRKISSIYKGTGFGPVMNPVLLSSATYPGYLISDLATCVFPVMNILNTESMKLKGNYLPGAVSLSWTAEGFTDASDFILERKDGNTGSFRQVATVLIRDASTVQYQFTDRLSATPASQLQYRIGVRKADGSVRYSNTLQVQRDDDVKTQLQVLENPFAGSIKLEVVTTNPGVKQLLVYDNNGSLVMNEKTLVTSGVNKITIDKGSSLKNGMYILQLVDGLDNVQVKMLKR